MCMFVHPSTGGTLRGQLAPSSASELQDGASASHTDATMGDGVMDEPQADLARSGRKLLQIGKSRKFGWPFPPTRQTAAGAMSCQPLYSVRDRDGGVKPLQAKEVTQDLTGPQPGPGQAWLTGTPTTRTDGVTKGNAHVLTKWGMALRVAIVRDCASTTMERLRASSCSA